MAGMDIVLQQIVIPLPGGLTLSLVLVPIVVGAVLTVWMLVKDLYVPAVLAGVLLRALWLRLTKKK